MPIQSRNSARLYSCMIFINAEGTAGQDSVLRHASGLKPSPTWLLRAHDGMDLFNSFAFSTDH